MFASTLWRLKYGGDHTLLTKAVGLLTLRIRNDGRISDVLPRKSGLSSAPLLREICQYLINEWMSDKCTKCRGRGRTGLGRGGVRSVGKSCGSCGGNGKRRINGAERSRLVGVTPPAYWKIWHPRFTAIRDLIIESDVGAVEDVRIALRGPRE